MKRNIDIGHLTICGVVGCAAYFLMKWLFPTGAAAKIETLELAVGWGGCILIGLIGLAVVFGMFTGKINLAKLVSEANGDASMSRFQLLIFTFVISLCLLLITISDPKGPSFPKEIPPEILGLLGISAGSYVISKSLQNNVPSGVASASLPTATGASPTATGVLTGAPAVTITPAMLTGVEGQAASLAASAAGDAPLMYEWQRADPAGTNWLPVASATQGALTIALGLADNGAQYRCKVSNACGSTVSSPVMVSVMPDRG